MHILSLPWLGGQVLQQIVWEVYSLSRLLSLRERVNRRVGPVDRDAEEVRIMDFEALLILNSETSEADAVVCSRSIDPVAPTCDDFLRAFRETFTISH